MRFVIGLILLFSTTPGFGQSHIDTAGVGALIDQAMNRSEVMPNLQHLSDVIGPRLSVIVRLSWGTYLAPREGASGRNTALRFRV